MIRQKTKQFVYTATASSTPKDLTLGKLVNQYNKHPVTKTHGLFMEGKNYIVFKAGDKLLVSGFFRVVTKEPGKKDKTAKYPGYVQFEVTPSLAKKYLKFAFTALLNIKL